MQKLLKIIHWLTYLFIFLLPFQTRLIYKHGIINNSNWDFGTMSIYLSETILGIIMLLTIIYTLSKLSNKKIKTDKNRKLRIALLLLIMTVFVINTVYSISPELSLYKLNFLILGAGIFFSVLITKPKIEGVLSAFVFSGLIQSLFAIKQFATQKIASSTLLGMASQSPDISGVPVVQFLDVRWLRTFGTLPHPNILAGFLVICLFMTIGLFLLVKHPKLKKVLSLTFPVMFFGLLTTLSRSAILAFVVSLVVFSILINKDKKIFKSITKFTFSVIIIFILFTLFFPNLITTRTFSNDQIETASNIARVNQYKNYSNIIEKHWIYGTGLGSYTLAEYIEQPNNPGWSYQPIHNTYLLIIAELGIIGIFILSLFILYILKLLYNNKNLNISQKIGLICLISILILMFFDHYLWSFYFGIMLMAVLIALPQLKLTNKK